MDKPKFALREVIWPATGARGLALCDAETGEIIEGQKDATVKTEYGIGTVTVTLEFFNLPIYGDPKTFDAYGKPLKVPADEHVRQAQETRDLVGRAAP